MLTHLSIKNYALIEHSEIDFSKGFSIITGETGAGKSILLDALALVLGKRADLSALRNQEEKCVIEVHFDISNYSLQRFFQENDLDFEKQTIIRREVLPSGKSRIFVNDCPTTLNVVSELGKQLIDIHSQHQTQNLFQDSFYIDVVDALAQHDSLLEQYKKQLAEYKKQNNTLKQLQQQKTDLVKEQDYNSFLLNELLEAQLKDGEQEILEEEQEKLSNVELVREHLSRANEILISEQYGILALTQNLRTNMQKISVYSAKYQQLFDRLQSVEIELKDISQEIEEESESLYNDPKALEEISTKLQIIYNLQKKHQVDSIADLLKIQNELDEKVFVAEGLDAKIEKLVQSIELLEAEIKQIGHEIHLNRKKVIPQLIEEILQRIRLLGMENAQFQFKLEKESQFYANGMDSLEVLFSANKGMDFTPLKKAASGGEMSRIMLAIKAVLAQYSNLPTIIFDEIDTGVSGEIADKMGVIMKQMSKYMQLFSITHLPQVASKGDVHYKVFKNQNLEITESKIEKLSDDKRLEEIAKMLSGDKITQAAIDQAKALLDN